MTSGRTLVCGVLVLLASACGGASDDGGSPVVAGERAAEVAYQKAYRAAWVRACKAAVADIRRTDANRPSGRRAAKVKCTRPVEQMEGNTSVEPAQAADDGRQQGVFDGCAYAWDESYGATGEVLPRCERVRESGWLGATRREELPCSPSSTFIRQASGYARS